MLNAVVSSFDKVLKANLTTDTYEVITAIEDMDSVNAVSSPHKLTELLEAFVSMGYIYKDDVLDYYRYTSIDYLRDFLKNSHGANNFWMRYRRKVHLETRDEYHWSVMRMVAAEGYTDDNQLVYIFVDDIDAAYKMGDARLDSILTAMCENFVSIFYVDLKINRVSTYRLFSELVGNFGDYIKMNHTYEELMNRYVSTRVHPDDQQRVLELSSAEYLKKRLITDKAYSIEYRLKTELGIRWFRMKIARIDESDVISDFTCGFEEITDEKHVDEEYYRVGKKILVVEDSDVNRSILCAILESEYDILEAENGEKAYQLLDENSEEVAVILTDLEMPVMNGYDFISKVRSEHKYNSVPIIVTTANSEIHVEVKCLKIGASDFVSKPYNPEVVRHRVRSLIKLKESTAMLNTLERDSLTGLYSKEFFYQRVADILDQNQDVDYQILCTDIENFKIVNEKYGITTGDKVLTFLAEKFGKVIPDYEIGGRISGDRFAILRRKKDVAGDMNVLIKKLIDGSPVTKLALKFGVYDVDRIHSVQEMCDRALLAVETIKGKYGVNSLEYDDNLRQDLLKQQQILDNMETALNEKQFQVYYQPKHDIRGDEVGGAEALVRWIHPTIGFMNPGDFIPLFEQNGFISRVDSYVFRQVCAALLEWQAEGKKIVPISVNLSRRDFEREDLAKEIIDYTDGCGLAHDLIHIEITESAFSDNPGKIAAVVNRLHNAGFVIELDDFGSGYSSLTTLSSMDIDVMKLDMSLIRNDNPEDNKSALAFSMQLAQMLNLKTVSEGVETIEQVERIKSLGGDYVQGYFYSKPLPKDDFEAYLRQGKTAEK